MNNQSTGQPTAQPSTYQNAIARLKSDFVVRLAALRTNPDFAELESTYLAIRATEQNAGIQKTSFEELLGITSTSTTSQPPTQPENFSKVLGDQQESEAAAEIEKGS